MNSHTLSSSESGTEQETAQSTGVCFSMPPARYTLGCLCVCTHANKGWTLYMTTFFSPCLSPHIASLTPCASQLENRFVKPFCFEFQGGYLAGKQLDGLEHNSKVNGLSRIAMTRSWYPPSTLSKPLHYSSVHFSPLFSLVPQVFLRTLFVLCWLPSTVLPHPSFLLSLTFFNARVSVTWCAVSCSNYQNHKMSLVKNMCFLWSAHTRVHTHTHKQSAASQFAGS